MKNDTDLCKTKDRIAVARAVSVRHHVTYKPCGVGTFCGLGSQYECSSLLHDGRQFVKTTRLRKMSHDMSHEKLTYVAIYPFNGWRIERTGQCGKDVPILHERLLIEDQIVCYRN
jgi:hypothetical protein